MSKDIDFANVVAVFLFIGFGFMFGKPIPEGHEAKIGHYLLIIGFLICGLVALWEGGD